MQVQKIFIITPLGNKNSEARKHAAETSADRHRRNRTFSGQFSHPVVIATRQNNSYCFHFLSPALIITSPPANTPSG